MIVPELLGFIGGLVTSCSLIPQLVRVYRLKSAREISLPFTVLFLAGVLLWLVYGISLWLPPVILWNSVGAVLMAGLLVAKLMYGRKSG